MPAVSRYLTRYQHTCMYRYAEGTKEFTPMKFNGSRRRINGHNSPWAPSFQQLLMCLFLLVVTVMGLTLHALSVSQQKIMHEGTSVMSFEQLYGLSAQHAANRSSSGTGPHQLLVLSYFNSSASLMARLLMLMGVFAGDSEQLKIDAHNQLRWWELKQVAALNDLMLSKYSAPGLPPRLARGFSISAMSNDDLEYYRDRVHGVMQYLGHFKPWLLKDPRLAWLAPLWTERLEAPLCILVVNLQPALLAAQLGAWHAAAGEVEVSPVTHLERWTNSTLSALQVCQAVPTIVVPSSVLEPPLLQPFLAVLQQHLKLAGVQGTRIPSDQLLHEQYITHLNSLQSRDMSIPQEHRNCRTVETAAGPNGTLDSTALLHDSCNWLPAPRSQQLDELPLPTRALLETLTQHLDAHLVHPQGDFQYSRVAAALHSAYSRRVKQLVQLQPGHASSSSDHKSITALITDALRTVASEYKLPHYLRQA